MRVQFLLHALLTRHGHCRSAPFNPTHGSPPFSCGVFVPGAARPQNLQSSGERGQVASGPETQLERVPLNSRPRRTWVQRELGFPFVFLSLSLHSVLACCNCVVICQIYALHVCFSKYVHWLLCTSSTPLYDEQRLLILERFDVRPYRSQPFLVRRIFI